MDFLRISVAAAFFILTISACNNNEQGTATSNIVGSQGSSQTQGRSKPAMKKKVSIDEIDFSKYPGVIKPAAFGYYFGLTREQIEGAGIELETKKEEGTMDLASTTSAPIPWADAESYLLVFHEGKLLKIVAYGKDIINDATGSEGKKMHKELRDSIAEKYGKPSDSYHSVGKKIWKEADEFYQCLAYDGCGGWVDLWSGEDKSIMVSLRSRGERGQGFVTIGYEAQPEWDAGVDAMKAKKKLKTKKGL